MIVNSHENFGPDIGYAKNNKNTWYSLCKLVKLMGEHRKFCGNNSIIVTDFFYECLRRQWSSDFERKSQKLSSK
jgi:hypothetical protein